MKLKQYADGRIIDEERQVGYVLLMKTGTGYGDYCTIVGGLRAFHVILTGTGAITATVTIGVSNDPSNINNFITLKTFTLSGNDRVVDGVVSDVPWPYVIGQVSAITGTGASVDLSVAV